MPDDEYSLVDEDGILYPVCKFEDCNGGLGDIWSYDKVRRDYPEIAVRWPMVPEEGKRYSLYDTE